MSRMRQFINSSALRHACLQHANTSTPSSTPWVSTTAALASLAHDLRHARAYPEALAALTEAEQASPASASAPALLAMRAELLSCSGQALQALTHLARALKAPAASLPEGTALQELDLLRRALRAPALPASLRQGLQRKLSSAVETMLAAGPWRDPLQLPSHFNPALRSLPWHTVDAPGYPTPALQAAVQLLQRATAELLAEYNALQQGGLLEPETECIAEPVWLNSSSSSSRAGQWWVYTANAPWRRPLDALGCSAATAPVACALLARLAATGLAVQRVGYSALWPGALLHPHYGSSNSVLKLHLGLRVPVCRGVPCAALTVGGVAQPWQAGKVLFFDDSFLHSVEVSDSECCAAQGERVVLQVVLQHPDLHRGSGAKGL